MENFKICRRCNELLPATIFSSRGYICKPCDALWSKERRQAYRARNSAGTTTVSHKRCSTCREELESDQFARYAGSVDGLDTACKQCKRAGIRARQLCDGGRISKEHTLYVLRNTLLPTFVKIGRSSNVNLRARQLSDSQPFEIEICYEYPGYGFLEQLVHDKVRSWQVANCRSREWFTLQPEQANGIIGGVIAEWELTHPSS